MYCFTVFTFYPPAVHKIYIFFALAYNTLLNNKVGAQTVLLFREKNACKRKHGTSA